MGLCRYRREGAFFFFGVLRVPGKGMFLPPQISIYMAIMSQISLQVISSLLKVEVF